ncbi:MAG: hypothetical protein NUW12_06175 [Firmicutes bacterium]|jgi:L-fucose isomerase-like protein|nr:hypothetical protein [Bacillota bacterium]MDH7495736.1 hypothetical protein [Bacillota bacterium]
MVRVSVVPFGSPLRDKAGMQERVSRYIEELRAIAGYDFSVAPPEARPEGETYGEGQGGVGIDITLILALSGGIEAPVLEFLARSDEPALILAHPADNAVAAALEILAFLAAEGRKGRIVQAVADWRHDLEEQLALFAARVAMKRARLGVVGTRDVEVMDPWRLAQQVRRVWGPRLVYMDLEELVHEAQDADESAALDAAEEFTKSAKRVAGADRATLLGAAKIYVGLDALVRKHRLDAVTVKCFDLLPLLKNTGCYALARLNEDGIPAACEADVLSALGMLLLRELTGEPSFMANPTVIYPREARVVLAHCTMPRTMATSYTIRSHFESGIGAAIHGDLPCGPVTVARIGGRQLAEVFAVGARLIECGSRDDMCRTQLTVEFRSRAVTDTILTNPLGNHHLVVLGDWETRIRDFVSLFAAGM